MPEGQTKEATSAELKANEYIDKVGELVNQLNALSKEYGVNDVSNSILVDSYTSEFKLVVRYDVLITWFS